MADRIRQPIDQAALEAYLTAHVPAIVPPLSISQFSFGQSNPTYCLTDVSDARYVLRKKPPGKLVSRTAHKVEREYRIMHALSVYTRTPVPRMYCLCKDEGVLGSAWYIMEYLDGRIFEDFSMPGVSPEDRTAMWKDAVKTLAQFHAVDPDATGLGDFGKSKGFYERQLATWSKICEAQAKAVDVETGIAVEPLPRMEELVAFFTEEKSRPADRATLVHGDFKIDNIVFHKTEPRVVGILDWEMATIGHPLSDICNFLMKFFTASAPMTGSSPAQWADAKFLPGATPGLPSREQLLDWYANESYAAAPKDRRGGYNPPRAEVAWGMAFGVFRLAAVCQGIAARYAARQASSAQAARYALERGPLAEFAWELSRGVDRRNGSGIKPNL